MFKRRAIRKSPPARRNLKVAVATGVSPSFKAILTTMKELPQKMIRADIRNVLKILIVLVDMLRIKLLPSLIKDLVEKTESS